MKNVIAVTINVTAITALAAIAAPGRVVPAAVLAASN